MATADTPDITDNTAPSNGHDEDVIMTGFLTKQGGLYRNWKKRFFILKGTSLLYYKNEGDASPKKTIDLTTGRGVRSKAHTKEVQWPDNAKNSITFALAVEGRTYYFYGTDASEVKKWRTELTTIVNNVGNPTDDWEQDSEGQPEPIISKVIRNTAKFGSELAKKFVKDSGLVDEDTAKIVEGVADGVEHQAEAGRDASLTDRAKMAVGDTAGVIGDNVDNDAVGVVCDVVKEQAEADDDTTMGQRLGMATGTALQGTSGMVDNEIAAGVMNTAGGIIHDQAEADTDASIQERIAIGVGSAANGVGDSVDDDNVKLVTKAVSKGSGKVAEQLKEEREKKDKENNSNSSDEEQ